MDTLAEVCRAVRVRTGADEDAEAQAQRMYDSRWATLSKSYEGMWHLTAMLDPEAGEALTTALAPLLVKQGVEDTTHRRAAPRRRPHGPGPRAPSSTAAYPTTTANRPRS